MNEIPKKRSSNLLAMLKRKFVVLLCFVLASMVILHLLTDNHGTNTKIAVKRKDLISSHQKDGRTNAVNPKQDIYKGEANEVASLPVEDTSSTAEPDDLSDDPNTDDEEEEEEFENEKLLLSTSQPTTKLITTGSTLLTLLDVKTKTRGRAKDSTHERKPKNKYSKQNISRRAVYSNSSSSDTRTKVNVGQHGNTDCSYEGLDGSVVESNEKITCVPHKRTEQDCRQAYKYFEEYNLDTPSSECDEESAPAICTIKTDYRFSWKDEVIVKCNPDSCGDEGILLGCRDKKYGLIPQQKHWQSFNTVEDLQDGLPIIIKDNSRRGFNFCFLKCSNAENEQSIIFPPILKRSKMTREQGINVNILVEDAVSRPHFYRSLPQTVNALRQLKRNSGSAGVTVLDFKLYQSYASFTLANLRMLFTGRELLKTGTGYGSRDNGIGRFMKEFRAAGYQTLAQEDYCFFDPWGTVLSPEYKKKVKPFTKKFENLWKDNVKSIKTKNLDNTGLTHFECEGLLLLGHTNPFKNTPRICHNGKFTSEYLFKYVEQLLSATEKVKGAAPALVYTHLNTAHESSGERIRTDDLPLASFVRNMSMLQNTITVILSDHGSKTTDYSISTFHGRLEVFSPFMFMIIPENVSKKLGEASMKALATNQNRLVTLLDVYRLLKTIIEPSRMHSRDSDVTGLRAPVPLNRTCANIEGLSSDAYCRCQGWNHFISSKSHMVYWLAEKALGEINNRISTQYISGGKAGNSLGYGACARFVGKSVERAQQQMAGKFVVTTFVLVVKPAWGPNSVERFEVQLNYSSVGQSNVTLTNIMRLSVFGKYETCKDKSVDIKLCACASRNDKESRRRPGIKELIEGRQFGIKTEIRFLNSRCLVFGVRKLKTKVINKMQSRVMVFEIANRCRRTSFLVKFGGTSRKSMISRKLPFAFRVEPRTITFLYAVNNEWKYGSFRPLVMLTPE